MATLNEIAYNIAGAVGKNTDPVFINRIKFQIEYFRALFLRRDAQTNFNIPDAFIQTLALDLEWVNAIDAWSLVAMQVIKNKRKSLSTD